ncbi:MAG: type II secretion system protein [Acidobacteriota bacterium]
MSSSGDTRMDRGYAMVVLIVGISIMAILMTAAMPVWKQVSQREKEAELVFRGEQYARAIGLFQRKNGPGTLPPSFDLLVEQKFLRKKFKDPITDDEFVPVALNAGAQAAGQVAPQPGGAAAGSPPAGAAPGGTGRGNASGAAAGAAASPGARGGTPGAGAAAGIAGVTSKSKESSIRLYKGRSHYNEWMFMFTPPAPVAGAGGAPGIGAGTGAAGAGGGRGRVGAPGSPGAPGAPGRPGGPGGAGPLFPNGGRGAGGSPLPPAPGR